MFTSLPLSGALKPYINGNNHTFHGFMDLHRFSDVESIVLLFVIWALKRKEKKQ